MDLKYMVYQLKYDSVHKRFEGTIACEGEGGEEYLVVNGVKIRVFHEKDPGSIGWGAAGAEYVCESTGVFTQKEKSRIAPWRWREKGHHFCTSERCCPDLRDGRQPQRLQVVRHCGLECILHHKLPCPSHQGGPREV
eukprot:UN03920